MMISSYNPVFFLMSKQHGLPTDLTHIEGNAFCPLEIVLLYFLICVLILHFVSGGY